jgi:creatinine amidohydrolase
MTQGEIWLERMTWPEVKEAINEGYDTVVLVVGAIEQHGPHLPLGTDTILGYALGERVAHKLGKALLAPVVRPGVSEDHMSFSGSITLTPETFKATVREYVFSLAYHSFRRIVAFSSHGGNVMAMEELMPILAAELPDVEFITPSNEEAQLNELRKFAAKDGIDLESLGMHAGECETSIMLAYAPDLVRKDLLVQGWMGDHVEYEREERIQDLITVSETGVFGDARLADQARGERYLEFEADLIVRYLEPLVPREDHLPLWRHPRK